MKSIRGLEKEIELKENEISKLDRAIAEVERDEELPDHKKRKRRRDEDTRILENPWPRDYGHERRVLENKIATGEAYKKARQEKIRNTQSQHDYFDNLVKTLSEMLPQDCPICMDTKVYQICELIKRARARNCQSWLAVTLLVLNVLRI